MWGLENLVRTLAFYLSEMVKHHIVLGQGFDWF